MYSIHMIEHTGRGHYLSVKGRTTWKTKRIALKHAQGLLRAFPDVVIVELENELGELVRVVETR